MANTNEKKQQSESIDDFPSDNLTPEQIRNQITHNTISSELVKELKEKEPSTVERLLKTHGHQTLKDISIITSGQRLRKEIERMGFRYGSFAEQSGVDPATLSRYMNDKQPMSEKYMRRAALLLDVSYDYLAGLTNDPTPIRYREVDIDDLYFSLPDGPNSEEEFVNKQRQNFAAAQNLLKELGISLKWYAYLGPTVFTLGEDDLWHPCGFAADLGANTPWTQDVLLKALYHCKDDKNVIVKMTYKGAHTSMSYGRFRAWLQSLIASIEVRLQDTFDIFTDVSMKVYDTKINIALEHQEKRK